MKKLKVGVIFGGKSGEHEVSLVSAAQVIQALNKQKYEVVPIGITKEGKWIAGDNSIEMLKSGKIPPTLKAVLPADSTSKKIIFLKDNGSKELSQYDSVNKNEELDVIIPVLHGTYGEDGSIQGLLELTNIPYIGCGVLGSAICMDKVIQKQLCEYYGIPVVKYLSFKKKADIGPVYGKVEKYIGYPCFIKPANLGSSVAINKAHDRGGLEKAIKEAFDYDSKIIIEQAVPNVREFEIGILGATQNPKASIVGEVIPSNEFYDYDAKYVDGKTETKIPANIPERLLIEIQELAKKAFSAVECFGMARIDFLYNEKKGNLFLNEINTIPGFTKISMYPKLWQESGLSYTELLEELINLSIKRNKEKNEIKTSYTPKEEWYK